MADSAFNPEKDDLKGSFGSLFNLPESMTEIHITITPVPGIQTMVFSSPSEVPIHVFHLANEGMVHIEFEDLDLLNQEINESACTSM